MMKRIFKLQRIFFVFYCEVFRDDGSENLKTLYVCTRTYTLDISFSQFLGTRSPNFSIT